MARKSPQQATVFPARLNTTGFGGSDPCFSGRQKLTLVHNTTCNAVVLLATVNANHDTKSHDWSHLTVLSLPMNCAKNRNKA